MQIYNKNLLFFGIKKLNDTFLKPDRTKKSKNLLNHIQNAWLFLEVFNLLQVNNTVSYTWLKDVTGRIYAVPNYLTNRQFNLRLYIQF
jgi:hypothetical protein